MNGTSRNFAPSDSICSLTAGRTSEASITAPSRLAVAIACRPATPAPRISTACRLDGARGGHQHRHEALVVVRGHQYGLVAGDIGLQGQHVHALCAGGA